MLTCTWWRMYASLFFTNKINKNKITIKKGKYCTFTETFMLMPHTPK